MAVMIPDTPPPDGPGAAAEQAFFEILRAGLDDEFRVYHGKLFLNRKGASEGEMDFLVCHRIHGLLAIECKGRSVTRDSSGRWVRRGRGPDKPMKKSPYAQVQKHIHDLQSALQPRLVRAGLVGANRFSFRFGHAVAFPHSRVEAGGLPLEGPKEISFQSTEMQDIEAAVMGAFRFWAGERKAEKPPSERKWKRFLTEALHPEIHIVSSLGAQLETAAQRFVQLTQEQARALEGIAGNPRIRITGGAGTGKTVLALEMARTLATRGEGKKVLLLCYNRHLSRHLYHTVRQWELPQGSVEARHFHSLCLRAATALEREIVFPDDQDNETKRVFWNEELPMLLFEALDKGAMERWDAIVVDEGQDFAQDWWTMVEDCLAEPEVGSMVIFHDDAQNIFQRQAQVPTEGYFVYQLSYNLRNTRHIADIVRQLGEVPMQSHPKAPAGEPPIVRSQAKGEKAVQELERLLRKLLEEEGVLPNQVAILTPHSRPNSLLAGVETLAGQPLTHNPYEEGVFHGTIGAYKGLESDVLILADIDPRDERCSRNARYVAASRACQLLYVFAKGDWLA